MSFAVIGVVVVVPAVGVFATLLCACRVRLAKCFPLVCSWSRSGVVFRRLIVAQVLMVVATVLIVAIRLWAWMQVLAVGPKRAMITVLADLLRSLALALALAVSLAVAPFAVGSVALVVSLHRTPQQL